MICVIISELLLKAVTNNSEQFHDDSHLESMQNIKKEIKKVVDKEHRM